LIMIGRGIPLIAEWILFLSGFDPSNDSSLLF